MDHYIDMIVRRDPEFSTSVILNALFARLHDALVARGSGDVGVSFPEASTRPRTMGSCLRLHGSAGALRDLISQRWWGGLAEHVSIGEPTQVPPTDSYCKVRRVQVKSNPERLRRRLAKRKGISLERARELIPDDAAKTLDLPFLQLKSASTGKDFKLFIQQEICETQADGEFNTFGLSKGATVYWF